MAVYLSKMAATMVGTIRHWLCNGLISNGMSYVWLGNLFRVCYHFCFLKQVSPLSINDLMSKSKRKAVGKVLVGLPFLRTIYKEDSES